MVTLITIGSEILNGEITNTNASRLSSWLLNLGFRVSRHLTVDDQEEEILWALNEAKKVSSWIITTGGLGPTSDDRTREVIAHWWGAPLELNRDVLNEIKEKMVLRGVSFKEGHRYQALFPRGSSLLPNSRGTAHGFCLKKENNNLIVLPGPPKEIDSIWEEGGLKSSLKAYAPKDSKRLYTWKCVGIAESDVAEKVESVLLGRSVEVAYRASSKGVFVKLWLDQAETELIHEMNSLFPVLGD